jgi:hypothetical protein
MLVESLNVFLSCLTHAELARAKDVSESEEYRVLSEVTQNVLHKWDQDVASGIRRPKDRAHSARPIEPPGYVNDDVKQYMMPLLNQGTPGLGVGLPGAYPLSSPLHNPVNERPSQHPGGTMNLDDIEQGFRSHMHAMRRIREQLRHQKVNSHHLSEQTSTNFPEVSSNTISHHLGVGAQPPLTPTIPTLQRTTSDSTGDYADASSSATTGSLQNSETSSVTSRSTPLPMADPQTKVMFTPRQETSPGPVRKRKRRPQFRFKTGLEDVPSPEGDGDGSALGSSSDDGQHPLRAKTALEILLTTTLFFDQ